MGLTELGILNNNLFYDFLSGRGGIHCFTSAVGSSVISQPSLTIDFLHKSNFAPLAPQNWGTGGGNKVSEVQVLNRNCQVWNSNNQGLRCNSPTETPGVGIACPQDLCDTDQVRVWLMSGFTNSVAAPAVYRLYKVSSRVAVPPGIHPCLVEVTASPVLPLTINWFVGSDRSSTSSWLSDKLLLPMPVRSIASNLVF